MRIEGVSVTSVDIASPGLINVTLGVTLGSATEITRKRIVVGNPDSSQIIYWGGLGTSLLDTLPLAPTFSAICGRAWGRVSRTR